jgi:hypothetical protein
MKSDPKFFKDVVPVHEDNAEGQAFLKAIAEGLTDVEEGRTVRLADAKKRLKLKGSE